jgi:TetR/AcrR family transcriptional repressor of mexJK operon
MVSKLTQKRSGRPKSEEKRDAIRIAAGQLFLKNGLHRSSMDAVAAEAGVSKQTVYSHFRSKQELFAAVIAGKVEEYFLEANICEPLGDVRKQLIELGRRFVDLIYDEEAVSMWRTVIAESVAHPEIAETFFEQGPRRVFAELTGIMLECGRQGLLQIEDPEEAAGFLISMLRGHPHMEVLCNLSPPPSAAWRKRHVPLMIDRFIRLYRPSA